MGGVMANSSSVVAQALLAAITLTYGSAFLGLWLQYRRPAMRAFALAWLALGAYSGFVSLTLPRVARADASAVTYVIVVMGVLAASALVNACYVVVDARRPRRWITFAGATIGLGLVLVVAYGGDHETGIRITVLGALGWSLLVASRAPASPGRRSIVAAFALLLMRPVFAVVAAGSLPGLQPVWLTALQCAVTIGAGFFVTVAVFSIERESAVNARAVLERDLAQSRRMDMIGRMASSVAHDFNNILTAVLSASQSASFDDVTAEERRQADRDIAAAVGRGKDLTRSLLEVARDATPKIADFDPAARIEALQPMLARIVGKGSTVECEVDAHLRESPQTVHADPVQFDQMLLNFAANARDAMPKGGALRVRCEAVPTPSGVGGSSVRVVVGDTGVGMPPDVAERAFEPFFTTKEPGKGTGLGLATTAAFVKQAGGEIAVESAPGAGSTFRVLLPARPAAAV